MNKAQARKDRAEKGDGKMTQHTAAIVIVAAMAAGAVGTVITAAMRAVKALLGLYEREGQEE